MQQRFYRPLVVILCVVACAAAASVSLWPRAGSSRTEDRNGDGRPDVWRAYDRQVQLSEEAVDTNFDGRSDVHEYFERGVLVRRESDRDFDDRIDLVQEFDPSTGEHARSVIDVDFDGTADLLVLFQDGQPVFSKWAHLAIPTAVRAGSALHADASPRTADGQLAPLEDPFRGDLALRMVLVAVGSSDCVELSTSGGLPASCRDVINPRPPSSIVSGSSFALPSSTSIGSYSPRGPPVAPLLA